MQYSITGSSKYVAQEEQINKRCEELGAELIGYTIDKENDRLPYYFINIESKHFISSNRVKDIFGTNFELQLDINACQCEGPSGLPLNKCKDCPR